MRFKQIIPVVAALAVVGCDSEPNMVGAEGVTITRVAIYQGVERVLAQDGIATSSEVPIIAGRDALVRVFYQSERPGDVVSAQLTLGAEDPIVQDVTMVGASSDADYDSTVNFVLDGSQITEPFDYSVALLEEGSDENPAAHQPSEGTDSHAVAAHNTLRIMLVPFAYQADGSGRLPDTSPAAIADYRDRFMQLYPVSNVEITVREAVEWFNPIEPFGQGWQEVIFETINLRMQDQPDDEVYYYSIFNPRNSVDQFCASGCVLGVTLLNDTPSNTGDVDLRMALGLGYPEIAATTALHEIGHSHGRAHVNCGPGLDPNSIDNNYPHAGESIGVWGWDIIGEELQPPNQRADIMGYCDNPWVSDYNYTAFHDRGRFVNQSARLGAPTDYHVISIDGAVGASFMSDMEMSRPVAEQAVVEVALADENGGRWLTSGYYRAFDHLPGGWLFVPKGDRQPVAAEMVIDGVQMFAER